MYFTSIDLKIFFKFLLSEQTFNTDFYIYTSYGFIIIYLVNNHRHSFSVIYFFII